MKFCKYLDNVEAFSFMLNTHEICLSLDFYVLKLSILILKKKASRRMVDFRSISLCGVFYKIISKVLANRLKYILHLIIDDCQSAFVPN